MAPPLNIAMLPGEDRWRLISFISEPPPPDPEPNDDSIDRVVYDMFGAPLRSGSTTLGAHEGGVTPLNGSVPSNYDWYLGAVRKAVGSPTYPSTGYTSPNHTASEEWVSHNGWGECIPLSNGYVHSVTDYRIQVDFPEIWHLVNGAWVMKKAKHEAGNLNGGYYDTAPFGKTLNFTTQVRSEATGGHSFQAAPAFNVNGTVKDTHADIHFFWSGYFPRIFFDASGVQVAIRTRMRLISDNPAVDLSQAKMLGRICGDVFKASAQSTHPTGINPAFALPRFKFVTSEWSYFGHVTGTEAQIRAYPTLPFLGG